MFLPFIIRIAQFSNLDLFLKAFHEFLLTFFGAGSQLRHHIVSEEAAQVGFLLFLVLVYPDCCTFPGLERHEFPSLDFLLPLGKRELFFAGLGL